MRQRQMKCLCCVIEKNTFRKLLSFDCNKWVVLYTSSMFAIQTVQAYFRKHYSFVTNIMGFAVVTWSNNAKSTTPSKEVLLICQNHWSLITNISYIKKPNLKNKTNKQKHLKHKEMHCCENFRINFWAT